MWSNLTPIGKRLKPMPCSGSVFPSDALTRTAGTPASGLGPAAEPQCGPGSESPGAHPAVWDSGGPGPHSRARQLAKLGTAGPDHTGADDPVASSCLQEGTEKDSRLCLGLYGRADAAPASFTSADLEEKKRTKHCKSRKHRCWLFCLPLFHCLLAHARCASRGRDAQRDVVFK